MSSLPAHGAGGPFARCPPPWPSPDGGPRLSSVLSESAWKPWYEPLPASVVAATVVWEQPVRRASHQGRRLNISLLLSLLFHALLLSLTFGGQEFGLPGFALPWQERRIEVPDLRVELAPTGGADPSPVIPAAPQPLPPTRGACSRPLRTTSTRASGAASGAASHGKRTPKHAQGEGWSKAKGSDWRSVGERIPEPPQGEG